MDEHNPTEDKPTQEKPNTEKNAPTIVGIGASAGGLAALKIFFTHIPQDCGLAFVIVVHLSPEHESHMADLLQPYVKMPVQQVTETIPLEPDRVYVIPPGCNLDAIDTHLRLSDLEEKRRNRAPIDHFFRTLAATHDGKSIGIILTGTGSDGTLGIKEVKERGGITIVQDPNEAEYDGMPQSAISTGLVDLVLPLAEIPKAIVNLDRIEPKIPSFKESEDATGEEKPLLQKIFSIIRARTGRDFSRYKRSTIMRRLERRMQITQIVELKDYLALLHKNPEEVRSLSDDLLITVTNFFRDPEVFKQLEQSIVPQLFKGKGPEDTIRVWSVGCATGEEAYSLAMILLEEAAKYNAPPRLQVFASDLHDRSLNKAREGYYPGDIETDVSIERLQRFFTKEDSSFRIRKEVREMVVFTPHNLLGDPPFSRIDLISCRNMLIYLQRQIQREVIDLFHYALNSEGVLLLGTSETLESSELFRTVNKGYCIFRKRNVPVPEPRLPVFPLTKPRLPIDYERGNQEDNAPLAYGTLHQWMVERYAPPSLLVSLDHKVVHLSEHVGRYLVYPGGEPTTNVFKLVREEFRIELQAALHTAKEKLAPVHSKSITVQQEGAPLRVSISVYPGKEPQQEGFYLIIFDDSRTNQLDEKAEKTAPDLADKDVIVREMQAELELTQHRLQAIIEEFETGQEEMKASNEEMQSTNEELRSTMEELETSKEELQSINEELSTVNQENRHKVEELAQLSGDLQNLLKATDIATLFLDRQLRILRFTPKVIDIFNVRMVDRGRPLADLTHRLGYHELIDDARQVLDKLVPIEREVKDEENRWYLTRVRPYRSSDDRIEGIVITFVEITERKSAEETLRKSEEHLRLIMQSATDFAIFTLDMDKKIADWNSGAERILGYSSQEMIGQKGDVIFTQEDKSIVPESETQQAVTEWRAEIERWYVRKDGNQFWGNSITMPLLTKDDQVRGFLKIITDHTQRRKMEESLRQAKDEAENSAQAKEEFLAHMSHEIRTPLNAVVGLATLLLGQNPKESQVENLQTMKFSAENLMVLVNDILDFSKIRAGKVSIDKTNVYLKDLLNSLQKTYQFRVSEQDNALRFVVDDQVPAIVYTDQLKLSQVLHNLISNALKFTAQGTVTVRVSLNRKKGDTFWVNFSVEDTGIGIAPDKLNSIFEGFTQADISTARKYGGTGLGLTITKMLLEMMDSRIEVESVEETGSRFFFTLPLTEGTDHDKASSANVRPETYDTLHHLKLLLVEDVKINRMVMMQFLQDWWKLLPDEAENGEEAVTMAQQKQYDMILMDVRMPVMDGYQAAKAIRSLPDNGYGNIPIIALTADTIHEVKKHAEAVFFTDVITKPFDPQMLYQKIMDNALKSNGHAAGEVPGTIKTPTDTVEANIDIRKVSELFNHKPDKLKLFCQKAVSELYIYQQHLNAAITARDEAEMDNIVHKISYLLDMLSLQPLEEMLRHSHTLLKENAPQDALEDVQKKLDANMLQTIEALKNIAHR